MVGADLHVMALAGILIIYLGNGCDPLRLLGCFWDKRIDLSCMSCRYGKFCSNPRPSIAFDHIKSHNGKLRQHSATEPYD